MRINISVLNYKTYRIRCQNYRRIMLTIYTIYSVVTICYQDQCNRRQSTRVRLSRFHGRRQKTRRTTTYTQFTLIHICDAVKNRTNWKKTNAKQKPYYNLLPCFSIDGNCHFLLGIFFNIPKYFNKLLEKYYSCAQCIRLTYIALSLAKNS